jgi:hypothetical protein
MAVLLVAQCGFAAKLILLMWGKLATVVNLRRIGNPPAAVQKIVRPIGNRPQVTNLPHNKYVQAFLLMWILDSRATGA